MEIHEPYQRRFRIEDFTSKICKGLDTLGKPATWVDKMLTDFRDNTALVLVATGIKVGEVESSRMTEVRVFYPRLKEEVWKNHKILKYYRELSAEEILKLIG